jgi:hypothetical protein
VTAKVVGTAFALGAKNVQPIEGNTEYMLLKT